MLVCNPLPPPRLSMSSRKAPEIRRVQGCGVSADRPWGRLPDFTYGSVIFDVLLGLSVSLSLICKMGQHLYLSQKVPERIQEVNAQKVLEESPAGSKLHMKVRKQKSLCVLEVSKSWNKRLNSSASETVN